MNEILNKIKNVVADGCVTISLNTHRTAPQNQADPIVLKNLVNVAEKRIYIEYKKDKPLVKKLIENINNLVESIDHSKNLESLILFINKDISIYARLPISVKNGIIIDSRFAIRDIVRARHSDLHYYILLLSMRDIHLIEAFNDRVVVTKPFSVVNLELHKSENRTEQANAPRQTNLKREFLNKVAKLLNEVTKDNNWPIIVCSEESTYFEYIKVADNKERIIGHFNFNSDKNHNTIHIIEAAFPIINTYIKEKNNACLKKLEQAVNEGRFEIDINKIWQNIQQRKGDVLFVKDNLYMPAVIDHDVITLVSNDDLGKMDVVDDIISEMIKENIKSGGEVAFISGDELSIYNGLVLTIRDKK